MTDGQRKQLDKLFNKITENSQVGLEPNFTEEGRNLLMQAEIHPAELTIKNLEHFQKKGDPEEVAKIRYDHYRTKRYSK